MSSGENSPIKRQRPINAYTGYRIVDGAEIPVSTNPVTFFNEFIQTRTPCIVKHEIPVDISEFTLSNIEKRLQYDELLQVERKHAFGFGLGAKRELLSLHDIVSKMKEGDDSYYLTTQYENKADTRENFLDDDLDTPVFEVPPVDLELDLEEEDGPDTPVFPSVYDKREGDSGTDGDGDGDEDGDSADESDLPDTFGGVDDYDALNEIGFDSDSEKPDPKETHIGRYYRTVPAVYVVKEFRLTEKEAWDRVKTLLQPPLTNVMSNGEFPILPRQFEPLVTQQINLWMGCTSTSDAPDLKNPTVESLGKYVPRGNSSGLHHDHAENLYLLVEGVKRFTIYLPGDAHKLFTVGDIDNVYHNGIINYHLNRSAPFWRPLRADGAIITDWAQWRLDLGDLDLEEEDYLESVRDGDRFRPCPLLEIPPDLDPPSFSMVPPILAHLDEVKDPEAKEALEKFAEQEFPGFLQLKKIEVWLKPGEMLYLPAGWFHEVTSFGDSENPQHIALNWWFVPPMGSTVCPYEDEYWEEDFEATKAALQWAIKTNQDKSTKTN